jgi:hypothetical protein
MDEHQADPARVGSTDEGMVIGSATDPSSLRSFVREGVAQEGVIPASDVNVWCAHCEHTYLQCPNCGKREWRLGDVPPLARYVREGVEIEQPETKENDHAR